MRALLASRSIRTLAAGLSAIVLILVLGKGVPAWYRWQAAARTDAEVVRERLDRALVTLHDTTVVRDSLRVRAARLSALAPTVLATSASAAAGTLTSLVSDAAADAGMRVASMQIRSDTAQRNGYSRAGVRAELVGDIVGLRQMLLALEGGLTLLSVRELSVMQPELVPVAGRPEALRVQLVVEGLIANPARPASLARSPSRSAR